MFDLGASDLDAESGKSPLRRDKLLMRLTCKARLTIVLAACGAVLLVAERTQAACGDYVHVAAGAIALKPSHDFTRGDATPSAPRGQCGGPNCSKAPISWPSAPIPIRLVSIEQWALPAGAADAPERSIAVLLEDLAQTPACQRSAPPERPPRRPSLS